MALSSKAGISTTVWVLFQTVTSSGPRDTDTCYGIFHWKDEAERKQAESQRYWDRQNGLITIRMVEATLTIS